VYVIIFSIDKNYEVCQELKNGVGGFNSILKNPRNSAGQAPLTPLVRACPEDYREGVAPTRLQKDTNNLKTLFNNSWLASATMQFPL
jgi:hypothetical protein